VLAKAAGRSTKAGSVYTADPLAQRKSCDQPGAHTDGGPQEYLGPAQLVSAHAHPLTEEIVLPLS
jgi:hypothetical protein